MTTQDLELYKKIPRNDLLLFLYHNSDLQEEIKIRDLFDRVNKPIFVFCLIIDHLLELNPKLVVCSNYISLKRNSDSFFPDEFKNMSINLTERGQDYVESRLLGFNIGKYETHDPFDMIVLRNGGSFSGRLSHISKMPFDRFSEIYKGSARIDVRLAYFLCTGKSFKENAEKKVFISYSWDNESHKKWVSDLAKNLSDHFLVEFDETLTIGMSPENYMKQNILSSDFVIIVFTPQYLEKTKSSKNSGVKYEFSIIKDELFRKIAFGKYIPLLKEGDQESSIPKIMRNAIYASFKNEGDYESSLDLLLKRISN